MKDPAFLFYPSDFLTGTMAMPFEERGKYITLLCFQHQSGRMSEETIRFLVGSFSDMLRLKFSVDENGLFYNDRLEIEIEKRNSFLESRRNNGRLGGRPKNEEKPLGKPNGKPKTNLPVNVNRNRNEVIFSSSFSSEFLKVWNELLESPKWKKKPNSAIQKSIDQLSRFDEAFSIKLIEKAISGDYQGVIFDNTEIEYSKWKNNSNGKTFKSDSIRNDNQSVASTVKVIQA